MHFSKHAEYKHTKYKHTKYASIHSLDARCRMPKHRFPDADRSISLSITGRFS